MLNTLHTLNQFLPVISLIVGVTVAFFIYMLNKSHKVKEDKKIFYNKSYHALVVNQIRNFPPEKEEVEKNIETAKYIVEHRNLCISDGIWKKIAEGVFCISNGTFLKGGIETYKEVSEETWDKINVFNIKITEELRFMKEKYEKEYYG